MYKLDLHTHSQLSPDGSLSEDDYRQAVNEKLLDYIAITDHNEIDFALAMQQELGERIIVGEEIMTNDGEIIGLYLTKKVPPRLSPVKTVECIKKQGGLVYIPHPFETVRSGITEKSLKKIIADVDIIEVANGRAIFQNMAEQAREWAIRYEKAGAASSDAHGISGWGRTYTRVGKRPTKENLASLLHESTQESRWPGIRGILYPKFNRLRKKLG